MFFFPFSTDAPIYHPPVVTIGMIAINVAAFVLSLMYPDSVVAFYLVHGDGLHPVQWLTANFMHIGVLHLVFNMISLWVFGLIVEGKIGWWRMLVVYLGIGVVQNAIIQVLMLWTSAGASLGASSIVYGLMAISLLWAPRNDVNCVFVLIVFVYARSYYFDVQVMMLAGVLIGLDLFGAMATGFEMSTPLLHTAGALVGGGVGLWMLKTDRVDCEGWDFFSVWAGKHEMTDEQLEALAEKDPAYQEEKRQVEFERRRGALNKIRGLVADGRVPEAYEFYRRKAILLDDWRLPEADLRSMIAAFHQAGQWGDSIPAMVELLQNSPENSTNVRLKLAQILLQKERRPAQAWNVLSKVDPGSLDAKQRTYYDGLKQMVFKAKEENPYDSVDADW
jgi:membrane associated rhomboid family serine protease